MSVEPQILINYHKTQFQIVLYSILICFVLCSCTKSAEQKNQARPVAVKFEAATKSSISKSFETVGELKADKEVLVAAEKAGQIEYVYVREGSYVYEGQLLVKIKGEDARAELDQAENDFNSFKSLYEQGAISHQELIKYETNLRRTKSTMSNLEIRSRISGMVGQIYIDPGDFVTLGMPIMDIVKNYPLRVSYNIPEKIIPLVKLGQLVEITSDADPNKSILCYVDFIAPRVDPKSRSVLVRARVDDSKASNLKANQFVTVKQEILENKDNIVVKETAIYLDQGQEYIYIAVEDPNAVNDKEKRKSFKAGEQVDSGLIAKRIPIKTGIRNDEGMVEIVSGISNGDLVIYAGLHSIYPGAKLMPVLDEDSPATNNAQTPTSANTVNPLSKTEVTNTKTRSITKSQRKQ